MVPTGTGHTLKIASYSTARFATWHFLDEFRLVFDAGDSVAAALASKCQRVRHVFLSHADRDHIAGLLQFNQLAARRGRPLTYYYPKDSGSFPAFKAFIEKFDPDLPKAEWIAVRAGDRFAVGRNHVVEVGENDHLVIANPANAGLVKSLDFRLLEQRRHLKPVFHGLAGEEIGRLRAEYGADHVTDLVDHPVFGYSGDTPGFDAVRWQCVDVLVHEATFIAPHAADRGHCELNDVINAAVGLGIKALVLAHFSNRYDANHIRSTIVTAAEKAQAMFPIYAVMPMALYGDVLAEAPVWGRPLNGDCAICRISSEAVPSAT